MKNINTSKQQAKQADDMVDIFPVLSTLTVEHEYTHETPTSGHGKQYIIARCLNTQEINNPIEQMNRVNLWPFGMDNYGSITSNIILPFH